MTNILIAFTNLTLENYREVSNYAKVANNRANMMGDNFESYVKDLFAGTFLLNEADKNEIFAKEFSWLGNNSNPPDLMIRDGDAVEMKKIERENAGLALNSSYPKHKLFVNDPKINSAIREAEDWSEKDIIYSIGTIASGHRLERLWFVYGDIYCASREIYEGLANRISGSAKTTENVEFTESKELAHVNRVDPLGITYLRVRGMWGIENPAKVFAYIPETRNNFANLIMRREKFFSFDELSRKKLAGSGAEIHEIRIKNPDNPAQLLDGILVSLRRKNG